ncbi:MAG: hypothetical protein NTX50_17775 [Candidatus Sumerlaeota bacterium]|nr:hypothetical protein [Candidatus Sumerlaeota bacterium]
MRREAAYFYRRSLWKSQPFSDGNTKLKTARRLRKTQAARIEPVGESNIQSVAAMKSAGIWVFSWRRHAVLRQAPCGLMVFRFFNARLKKSSS